MSNIYYEGYESSRLEDYFRSNPENYKLVRELCFAFNLKVIGTSKRYPAWVSMCTPDGIFALRVSTDITHTNDKGERTPQYAVYTPFYAKERGRGTDRRTLYSTKLSSLIGTMKRNKVVPTEEMRQEVLKDCVSKMESSIKDSIDDGRRATKPTYDVDTDIYHAFLKVYIAGESPDLLLQFDRTKLQKVLENYNKVDVVNEERKRAVEKILCGGSMYGIGVCAETQDYLIAKVTIESQNTSQGQGHSMTVNSLKRVKSITQSCEEFVPYLTMMKVAYESKQGSWRFLENTDGWLLRSGGSGIFDPDFEAISVTNQEQECCAYWTWFPCSAI